MRLQTRPISRSIIIILLMVLTFSCNNNSGSTEKTQAVNDSSASDHTTNRLTPSGNPPSWAPGIKPEMAVVIEKLEKLAGKPIESLDAKQARMQPTPADAVVAVMNENHIPVPPATCDTMGKEIPVTGGSTHIRIYTPKVAASSYPVIVYYHGGGWVIADINVYNSSAQGLCEQTGAVVVSVEYPKGPEHPFPAAHIVSFDAYQWVLNNITSIKGDIAKVAVVGESAGGNLAANVSIMARDQKRRIPVYEVLIYPVANSDTSTESYTKYAAAKPLNKPMMLWFVKNAIGSPGKAADPRISLVKANLSGLPPTLIIGAEIDPLQSEGKQLNDRLKDAKVETTYKLYDGVTHEFFGMYAIVPQAKDAMALVANSLKTAFGK